MYSEHGLNMSVRPESKDRWLPWLIGGFLFWPLFIVAMCFYFGDRAVYERAMLDYKAGRATDWFWDGYVSQEDAATVAAGGKKKMHLGTLSLLALVVILIVCAVLFALFAGYMISIS